MSSVTDSTFGDSVALDNTVKLLSSSSVSTPQIFPLLKLPAELRGMIYKPLLQAGDLSILRVSKFVSKEAASQLSKAAIFRINLGCPRSSEVTFMLTAHVTLSGVLTLMAPDYIQHLDLRLDLIAAAKFPIDSRLISLFTGDGITRQSCKVTFTVALWGPSRLRLTGNAASRAISALTGFRILTLRIEHGRDADDEAKMMKTFGLKSPWKPFKGLARRKLATDYKTLCDFLTVTLGRALIENNADKHCLTFWPRSKS